MDFSFYVGKDYTGGYPIIKLYNVTKDADGTVRTAFNTCQVCNGSPKAYFEEKGDSVVCQNCGNSFSKEDVGVLSGGCNPYPIFPEDRADTEDTVTISYDFLKSAEGLFTRWKENSPAD